MMEQKKQKDPSLWRELFEFGRERKILWIAPLVFMLLLVGGLFAFATSSVAPFIYALF